MGIDPKQQEPQLSGAYIRNLVKQLTSSNTKESTTKLTQGMSSEKLNPNPNPQPHKKQVRRRLHTSRPYQERLLDMAGARREIVTALKLHRESMKKQQQQQHKHEDEHQQHQTLLQVQPPPAQQCSGYLENPSYGSLSYPPPTIIFPKADFQLPNRRLGLNLNFQDFTNLDTNSPSVPVHQAMDEEEVAEMRSIGDQHQMEWNDAMNLVTSARWSKFLKTMEIEPEESLHPFDEAMEIPSWLNPGDVCFQQQFDGLSSHNPADLPWMDIGDIDGMDGDWLS